MQMIQPKSTIRAALLVALALTLMLSSAAARAGTEGRISGQVIDQEGKPIEGVKVTVAAVDLDIQRGATSNKKGKFTITVLNASRDFTILLEKEGFQSIEERIDPQVGGTLKPVYTMIPGQAIAPDKLAELQSKDKAAKIYNQGVKMFSVGDLDAAVEQFEAALAEDPELGLAHLALARILVEARRDPAAGLPHAEKANELVPDEELTQLVLFDALWDLERYDRAVPLLDEMIASGKAPDKVAVRAYNAGIRDVKSQDWPAARRRYEQVLQLDPNLVPAHLTLGQIVLNAGEIEEARKHALAYAEARPDDAKGLDLLYRIHLRAGEEEAAAAVFDRMAASDPEQIAKTFFEVGVDAFNAGQLEEARQSFDKVLRAQPDHPHAHYFLGLVSASSGDVAKAKQYLQRFVELAPDDPEAAVARDMIAGL